MDIILKRWKWDYITVLTEKMKKKYTKNDFDLPFWKKGKMKETI